jgi:hypothetical protein
VSIYRTLDDGPTSEVSVQREVIRRKGDESGRPGATSSGAAYLHLRKARPATEPFPGTFKWIARLPHDIRPFVLLRRFPRVANSLATAWSDRDAFRNCLYDLLVDKRGNREGFPPDVLVELLALRKYFDDHCYPYGHERP